MVGRDVVCGADSRFYASYHTRVLILRTERTRHSRRCHVRLDMQDRLAVLCVSSRCSFAKKLYLFSQLFLLFYGP